MPWRRGELAKPRSIAKHSGRLQDAQVAKPAGNLLRNKIRIKIEMPLASPLRQKNDKIILGEPVLWCRGRRVTHNRISVIFKVFMNTTSTLNPFSFEWLLSLISSENLIRVFVSAVIYLIEVERALFLGIWSYMQVPSGRCHGAPALDECMIEEFWLMFSRSGFYLLLSQLNSKMRLF